MDNTKFPRITKSVFHVVNHPEEGTYMQDFASLQKAMYYCEKSHGSGAYLWYKNTGAVTPVLTLTDPFYARVKYISTVTKTIKDENDKPMSYLFYGLFRAIGSDGTLLNFRLKIGEGDTDDTKNMQTNALGTNLRNLADQIRGQKEFMIFYEGMKVSNKSKGKKKVEYHAWSVFVPEFQQEQSTTQYSKVTGAGISK